MSNVTLRPSAPAGFTAVPPANADVDFNRRWAAWQARGLAHDRVVRQRFLVVILIGAIAIAAALAYRLLAA
jgi:hypothetical protein